MTDRIKELQKQCVIHDKGTVLDFDYDKFAELIVKECIEAICNVPLAYGDYRDQIEGSMRDACALAVALRFGIKV